jgi:3-oxoacyl-[acyl-carrier protein] reductase
MKTVKYDLDLSGEVALVTGGTKGIGRAVSLRLASYGAYVIMNYSKDDQAAEQALAMAKQHQEHCEMAKFSVADYEAVKDSIKAIDKRHGQIDILVNNAGIAKDQIMPRMSPEDWDEVVNTNLKGCFNCSRAAARIMVRRRFGRIINISSIIAHLGRVGQTNYAASKAGIEGLTRSMALELAGSNITVNAVAPGYIETEFTAGLPDKMRKEILERIPMGRAGTPEDVARVVHFLASGMADYITGQVIHLNGGLYFG